MDRLIFPSLSQAHYSYGVGMSKVPAVCEEVIVSRRYLIIISRKQSKPYNKDFKLEET